MTRGELTILMPHINISTFIQTDIDLLKTEYNVRLADCGSVWRSLWSLRHVLKANCIYCWFGSLRFFPLCLLAKVLGKKIIIIAGGYDVACVPAIPYGNMVHFIPR